MRSVGRTTDIPLEQRGDQLLKQFTYQMQRDLALAEWVVVAEDAVERVLSRMFVLSGERAGDEWGLDFDQRDLGEDVLTLGGLLRADGFRSLWRDATG